MLQSKLMDLLSTLSAKQRREMSKFIEMPGVGTLEPDKEVMHALLSESTNRKFDEDEFWAEYAKDKGIPELRRIKNRMQNLLRKYLIYYLSKDEDPNVILMLLRHMRKLELPKQINSEVRYLSKVLDDEKNPIDGDYSYYKYKEYHEKVAQNKGEFEDDGNLQLMEESLDQFYLERKLQYYIENNNRADIINSSYDEANHDDRKGTYTFSVKPNTKGAELYHYLLCMGAPGEQGEYYFNQATEFLAANKGVFKKSYLSTVYPVLMNKAAQEVQRGDFRYASHYINFIKGLEASGSLLENNEISNAKYLNSVLVAMGVGNYGWARDFAERYAKHIVTKDRDSMKRLALAIVTLHEGNAEAAQKILPRKLVSDRLFVQEFMRQTIKLQIAYGKGQFDVLPERVGNFRRIVKEEERLSDERKEQLNAFADCMLDLAAKKEVDADSLLGKVTFSNYVWLCSLDGRTKADDKKKKKKKKKKDKKGKKKSKKD